MFVLAGTTPLNVHIVVRTIFYTEEEALEFKTGNEKLSGFSFLNPMTMEKAVELFHGKNVLLTPLSPNHVFGGMDG